MGEVISASRMRETLAGFSTGLSVVAASVDGRTTGMQVNSLVSVSLRPPLVSFAVTHDSTTWPVLQRAKRIGISVLGEEQKQMSVDLRRPSPSRFEGIEMTVGREGAAYVAGALATLEVAPWKIVEAGDHALVLLEVLDLHRDPSAEPLVFFGSRVRTLAR